MGVRGLKTFIEYNSSRLTSEYRLSNSYLVIDGNNIYHLLYFTYLDSLYGGNYDEFEDCVRHFFGNLLKCKVTPVVILDGSAIADVLEDDTEFEREEAKNKALLSVVRDHKFDHCQIIPLLAYETMLSTMRAMDIVFTQCDFEADSEIAVIANAFQCPVLSQDSDFYIYDMPNGFIPINSLEIEAIENVNGECFYMPCRIYHIDMFLSVHPKLLKEVLPIFSCLLGYEYADVSEFQELLEVILCVENLPKGRSSKIRSVLQWLKGKTYNEVIQHFYAILNENSRDDIISMINSITNLYNDQTSSCLPYLCDILGVIKPHCIQCDEIDFLPKWLLEKIRNGYFLPKIIAICMKTVVIPTQLDYLFFPSSHNCSKHLTVNIYSIICNVKPIDVINEYIRDGIALKMEKVYVNHSSLCLGENFRDHGSLDGLEAIFYEIINIEKKFELKFPPKMSIVFLSIVYWIRNAFPQVTEHQLDAVILSILYYGYVLPLSNGKHCSLFEGCKTETIWQSIEKSDVLIAKDELTTLIRGKFDYSIKTIHNYSQLQSCLYHMIQLKRLLIDVDPISLYLTTLNGKFIHNITQKLKISPNPHNYINDVLGHKTFKLFLEIRSWLLSQVTENNLCKYEYWW